MPSKGEQNVGGSRKELLCINWAGVHDAFNLAFMHSCAHHIPGCECCGNQAQEGEHAVVLEGREQHCEQRYHTPYNCPSPVSTTPGLFSVTFRIMSAKRA